MISKCRPLLMCVLDILDQNVPIDINLLNGREHTK